jgi:hypothetical protein
MAAEEIGSNEASSEKSGPEKYAPRNRRVNEVDRITTNSVEAEIHSLVRRDVVKVPKNRSEAAATGNPAKERVNLLIGRVVGESLEEIDRVILDLQSVRHMLRNEGERVSREIAGYVSLNHAATTAMKVISGSLKQWKGVQDK